MGAVFRPGPRDGEEDRIAPGELATQESRPRGMGLGGMALVLQRGLLGDRFLAGLGEFGQGLERFRGRRSLLGSEGRAHERQHPGIGAIGFGKQTHRLGEQPGPQRIDHRHSIAGGVQGAMDLAMPFACGLDHDQANIMAGRRDMDIDTNAGLGLAVKLEQFLALHAGLARNHLFKNNGRRRTDQAVLWFST